MKIGILGCGNMGRTLGWLWSQAGHSVTLASGRPDKSSQLASQMGARSGDYAHTVAESEVLLYTLRKVPPTHLVAERSLFHGKVVIDCNQEDIPLQFDFRPQSQSLAQWLAGELPLSQVVKAFNLHPVELYQHGPERLRKWGVQSFFCSDFPEARAVVRQLAQDLGLTPFDCGSLSRAHLLESQANFARLFQLEQGQALVSQFQLVGFPEPPEGALGGRQPGYVPDHEPS